MRGHFSIEWMAQSSKPTGSHTRTGPVAGPEACGTHSESLPGFYCRFKAEDSPEQERLETRSQDLDLEVHQRPGHQQQQQQQQTSSSGQVTEAGFSSGTEEETSGYESEGGRSLSPSASVDRPSTSPPSPPAGRRPRTAFTAEQIGSLERAFKRNAYLGTQDKAELCKKLSLSDKQIRNWFQNRRMKLKRTVQDALAHACQANVASQFMHYSELQAYRPAPYPRYHHSAAAVAAAAPEASYVHPHGLQYASPLPLDSYYQYNGLPAAAAAAAAVLPPASPHLRGSYPTYPQYY